VKNSSYVIASGAKQSMMQQESKSGLLRGACHRAALCADPLARNDDLLFRCPRWLQLFALRSASFFAATIAGLAAAHAEPATVYFASGDGTTQLVGYLFAPRTSGPHPAVVMLHGRAGPYSANSNEDCTLVGKGISSPCDASSLSKRHEAWGNYWSDHGYLALLPDSFGPRNKGHGFGRFSHGDPEREDVNERTVRPLDAEGALGYLRSRADVVPDHIFLQGWSNGASTALNVMYRQATKPSGGFRAAMAFYPGCGPRALITGDYKASSPVTVFLGSDDEEVSKVSCHRVLDAARKGGSPIEIVDYAGATHDFDDPGKKRQAIEANQTALDDVLRRASGLFAR
jgi:dienelactone hydrolase